MADPSNGPSNRPSLQSQSQLQPQPQQQRRASFSVNSVSSAASSQASGDPTLNQPPSNAPPSATNSDMEISGDDPVHHHRSATVSASSSSSWSSSKPFQWVPGPGSAAAMAAKPMIYGPAVHAASMSAETFETALDSASLMSRPDLRDMNTPHPLTQKSAATAATLAVKDAAVMMTACTAHEALEQSASSNRRVSQELQSAMQSSLLGDPATSAVTTTVTSAVPPTVAQATVASTAIQSPTVQPPSTSQTHPSPATDIPRTVPRPGLTQPVFPPTVTATSSKTRSFTQQKLLLQRQQVLTAVLSPPMAGTGQPLMDTSAAAGANVIAFSGLSSRAASFSSSTTGAGTPAVTGSPSSLRADRVTFSGAATASSTGSFSSAESVRRQRLREEHRRIRAELQVWWSVGVDPMRMSLFRVFHHGLPDAGLPPVQQIRLPAASATLHGAAASATLAQLAGMGSSRVQGSGQDAGSAWNRMPSHGPHRTLTATTTTTSTASTTGPGDTQPRSNTPTSWGRWLG